MRSLGAFIISIITIALIVLLNSAVGGLPALGKLLDPINGWAANAEPTDKDFSAQLKLTGVEQAATIAFEDRLVPHIFAANDHDLYFAQGYLHAYFRLWQMDMQTRAAAGRIGEVVGEKIVKDLITGKEKNAILEFDRGQRRKGMVYAAEHSLKAMEADPRTKLMLDAYTAGINSYISSLAFKNYPLEYKLMGFAPEPWTNLKCALLLKYMADDLTGYTEDIALSILKDKLPTEDFELLYPQRLKGSKPVMPGGTQFDAASMAVPAVPNGNLFSKFDAIKMANGSSPTAHYETGVGSNNWALNGSKTANGAPILCNDPHLGLNLPSLWYEMQLQAPGINVYGVTLPGAPGAIIGFNDSLSWGLTNNYRDVKDYYEIAVIDNDFYCFDGKPQPFAKRNEVIGIKGKEDFVDTISYTTHGPVQYDMSFPDPAASDKKLALCWMAHRSTNELLAVYMLNRAKNYIDFTEAILHFECPAQNFIYADREGNIAIWGQGQFINKWKDQGRYVMRGDTSATLWGKDIPMMENPHALNPQQGYLASANQVTTDSTYPYWYNGYFSDFRAWRVNELLEKQTSATIADEMLMQNDVESFLAKQTLPTMLRAVAAGSDKLLPELINWNNQLNYQSAAASLFQIWWGIFYEQYWLKKGLDKKHFMLPSPERTMQLVAVGYDSIEMKSVLRSSYTLAVDSMNKIASHSQQKSTQWYEVKNTTLHHLAKISAFSYDHLKIGGWGNTINAAKGNHGPSWRMVVEMGKDSIRAFGVYPGGQSGNPGSKYYGSFVSQWVEGKYYPLLFLAVGNKQVLKYSMTLQPKK